MLGKWHDMNKWPLRNLVELWGTIIDQCLQFVYPFAIWVIARVETCLYNSASRMTPPSSSGLECEPWSMGIDQLSWLSLLKISPRQMAAQVPGYINILLFNILDTINIDILVSLYLVIHQYFGISIDTSTYFNYETQPNPPSPIIASHVPPVSHVWDPGTLRNSRSANWGWSKMLWGYQPTDGEMGSKKNWLVVDLPLWKMMDLVNWDDDILNIWKVICAKPPTRLYMIVYIYICNHITLAYDIHTISYVISLCEIWNVGGMSDVFFIVWVFMWRP